MGDGRLIYLRLCECLAASAMFFHAASISVTVSRLQSLRLNSAEYRHIIDLHGVFQLDRLVELTLLKAGLSCPKA